MVPEPLISKTTGQLMPEREDFGAGTTNFQIHMTANARTTKLPTLAVTVLCVEE